MIFDPYQYESLSKQYFDTTAFSGRASERLRVKFVLQGSWILLM